jgi:hypothetical protein
MQTAGKRRSVAARHPRYAWGGVNHDSLLGDEMFAKLRSRLAILFTPASWPGWASVMLGAFNYIPDWKSRWDFWSALVASYTGIPVIADWLQSPYLGLALIVCGLVYLVAVTRPRHVHHVEVHAPEAVPKASVSMVVHSAHCERDTPINEAIAHVSATIGDTEQYSPSARLAIRQRALDGSLHIRGRKEANDGNSNQTSFSAVYTEIPRDYWANSVISVVAWSNDPSFISGCQTQPETAAAWHPTDYLLAKNHYADLRVNMDEVRSLWPTRSREVTFPDLVRHVAKRYQAPNRIEEEIRSKLHQGELKGRGFGFRTHGRENTQTYVPNNFWRVADFNVTDILNNPNAPSELMSESEPIFLSDDKPRLYVPKDDEYKLYEQIVFYEADVRRVWP